MANDTTQAAFNSALPDEDTNTAFDQATAPTSNPAPVMAPPTPTPQQVNVFNPDGKMVSIPGSQLKDALNSGYRVAEAHEVAHAAQQAKFGSPGQQAIAGLEGAGEGATFGLSTGLETALGVDPADIRARAEANPVTHNVGQVAGLVGSAFIPVAGEANILAHAGEAAAEAVGLGGGKFLSQVGADAVKAAFEGGLFQGGDEVSRMFAQDPNQTAETAIADIGLAGVLGGVFGGTVGAGLRGANKLISPELPALKPSFVSEVDQPGMEAGDFKTSIENSNLLKDNEKKSILEGLKEQKPNAPEIEAAAARLGAPVMEGMTSASEAVQKAEDALINGAPTYSGLKRQELYSNGYKAAENAVDTALGDTAKMSKAEVGNSLKQSITSQLKDESQPISDMYNYIKQYHNMIPIADDEIPRVSAELEKIPELRLSPSSPGAKLVNDVFNEIGNIKTVDDIKTYRSGLFDRLGLGASPGEKRVTAIIADHLKQLEDNSIEAFAKQIPNNDEAKAVISSLVDQRKAADAAYKPFIKKVGTLADQLGKGRVYGTQDAVNFINDLTPEQVTQRLFSKNNSEFLKFFEKNFPEQMELMRGYQKGVLREAASKTGELSPKVLFNKVNALEPEIQRSVFKPEELSKLKDAETYLRAFPKNFNPSGTSGMSAFRSFFEHPTGAVIANARDFAIEKFIKAVGASPEVKNATQLAKNTVSGFNTAKKAVKAILNPDKLNFPVAIAANVAMRDKLKKLVNEYSSNPDKLYDNNMNNPVESYNTAFSATSARAIQYLQGLKPNTNPLNPLDGKQRPNAVAEAQYNRQLDIAQNPLLVLKHVKDGTLTPADMMTVKTIYPNMFNALTGQVQQAIMGHAADGKTIPYKNRMSLSLLVGQPLDSTMTPQAIMAAQPIPKPQPQAPAPSVGKPKRGTATLSKASQQFMTAGQAAEADKLKK